jgi:hypothetical protein
MLVKCITNERYEVSLEVGKIYQAREIPDDIWLTEYLYVTDESDEEYVYSKDRFEIIEE